MAKQRLTNYLRTHRRRGRLTQDEIAFLLNSGSGSKVSRYERFARVPSLQTAMAFEIIYGVPVRELFAGMYQKSETRIKRRAYLLTRRLNKVDTARLSIIKLNILDPFIRSQEKTNLHDSI
jgi:transcriptional regulator with XRE-family HTH domain